MKRPKRERATLKQQRFLEERVQHLETELRRARADVETVRNQRDQHKGEVERLLARPVVDADTSRQIRRLQDREIELLGDIRTIALRLCR
jgi:hypothetical protein